MDMMLINSLFLFLYAGDRCRLKEDVIPSLFEFRMEACSEESPRAKRMKSRADTASVTPQLFNDKSLDIQYETENKTTNEAKVSNIFNLEASHQNQSKQCNFSSFCKFSIESFNEDNKIVNYYNTGFQNYDHNMMFFHCLGPSAFELDFRCHLLDPTDQLFMTLIKLRQNKEDIELSMLFN
ncbi:unnamed protein product [Mytilus coruscus]|uniref:Uncharacterized protein n=1 Tax=Mytilus coruscus TaxID=42192 RepID=A0A6J8A5N0_MYTCO|nr:unnamed protein product [Mytilus coruscus]